MPTVLKTGPYRIYFYSHDRAEPAHVHVDRERFSAKFWLQPVELARNLGFRPVELNRIRALVLAHQTEFLEGWNEHFSIGG